MSPEFQARVALEKLNSIRNVNGLGEKELERRRPEVFEGKGAAAHGLAQKEKRERKLERKIGQLVIEKEILEKSAED